MTSLGITEAAALLGLSAHTLRYYERAGLLDPVHREAGRRRYDERDIAWLRFIQRLRATGMPMRQIDRYARLRRQGDSTLAERMTLLQDHLQALRERERELAAHRQALTDKIDVYRQMMSPDPEEEISDEKTRDARGRRRRAGGGRPAG